MKKRVVIVCAILLFASTSFSQQDSRAVLLLKQSILVMGGVAPADSLASGTISLVEGSRSENGTVRFATKGMDRSAEYLNTPSRAITVVYSAGRTKFIEDGSRIADSLEFASTAHSSMFPLVLLAASIAEPGTAAEYIGVEELQGRSTNHLRLWKIHSSFKSAHLAEFSTRELWLDADTALPAKVAFVRRVARGEGEGTRVEVFYSDYRNVAGALYPHQIAVRLNGTDWATVTIESVFLNTGLTDKDFYVGY